MTVFAYSESHEVATAVGQHIVKVQKKALQERGKFRIAVSGGSLGKVLKASLIDNSEIASQVLWGDWEIWFSDERLVPLDHADSNYGLFNELVLKNLPESPLKPKIHTIDESLLSGTDGQTSGADESKDKKIAEAYAATLPEDGVIDLILLGAGPDGHTASLFPGHKLLEERSELIAAISDSPKPPPRRITFTFPVLEKAPFIAFVAEGSGKAPILNEVFNDGESKLPAKLVTDLGPHVSWFVNDAAVEGVGILTSKY